MDSPFPHHSHGRPSRTTVLTEVASFGIVRTYTLAARGQLPHHLLHVVCSCSLCPRSTSLTCSSARSAMLAYTTLNLMHMTRWTAKGLRQWVVPNAGCCQLYASLIDRFHRIGTLYCTSLHAQICYTGDKAHCEFDCAILLKRLLSIKQQHASFKLCHFNHYRTPIGICSTYVRQSAFVCMCYCDVRMACVCARP